MGADGGRSKKRSQAHFTPEAFSFLRALARRNERAWFLENKERYERDVKQPFLDFISDFAPHLSKVSRHLVADPRSMFRIHRDTRFSKDKSPYKTHAGAHFQHATSRAAPRGESVHAPGYYLHLEPGRVFFACGLWRPPAEIATRVRRHIDANRGGWTRAVSGKAFTRVFQLGGDSLSRPPRGFAPDHPLVEHLKRKDFIASVTLSEKAACSPAFLDEIATACRTSAPLMEFLCRAVGLPW